MSFSISESGVKMTFPDSWKAIKYDAKQCNDEHDATYHSVTVNKKLGERNAVDVVAVGPDKVLRLIEVKESFADQKSTKEGKRPPEKHRKIARKYYDTVAGMICGWMHGDKQSAEICSLVFACGKPKIEAVLVIEKIQSSTGKGMQTQFSLSAIEQEMRNILKNLGFTTVVRGCDVSPSDSAYVWTISKYNKHS